jgi:hypothetical protein
MLLRGIYVCCIAGAIASLLDYVLSTSVPVNLQSSTLYLLLFATELAFSTLHVLKDCRLMHRNVLTLCSAAFV